MKISHVLDNENNVAGFMGDRVGKVAMLTEELGMAARYFAVLAPPVGGFIKKAVLAIFNNGVGIVVNLLAVFVFDVGKELVPGGFYLVVGNVAQGTEADDFRTLVRTAIREGDFFFSSRFLQRMYQ